MDDKFQRLEDKLDKVNDRLNDIDKNVAVYNEQLKIHIEGTVQNREQLHLFRQKFDSDFAPVKKHIAMVEGVLKFLGVISLLAGIAKTFGLI